MTMASEKRLIYDEDAKQRIIALAVGHHTDTLPLDMIINVILHQAPTVDAVEVVRCEKCVYCVNDEEEPGMCKCVESAEYEPESGFWLGFVEYHTPDFFCAYGERRTDHESESNQVD